MSLYLNELTLNYCYRVIEILLIHFQIHLLKKKIL